MKLEPDSQGTRTRFEVKMEEPHPLVKAFPKVTGHELSLNPTVAHPTGYAGAEVSPTGKYLVLIPLLMISTLGQQEKLIIRSQVTPARE